MADSYVCSGATLRCPYGERTVKLKVFPSRTVTLTNPPMANVSDHQSMVNIPSFGRCRNRRYPKTAAATAANHGHLTPMPCEPGTDTQWKDGKNDYLIKGKAALLKSSTCRCKWGATISIVNDGQKDTGTPDLGKQQVVDFEEEQKKELDKNVNDVLDGIQNALDVAGLAPAFGAIPDLTNAAISALRGNWGAAGMSLLAAVPGIGDAATAVKFAQKGLKAVDKGKDVAKAGAKLMDKGSDVAKAGAKATESGADAAKAGARAGDGMTKGGAEKIHDAASNNNQQLLKLTEKNESSLHGSQPYNDHGIKVDYDQPNPFAKGGGAESAGKKVAGDTPGQVKPGVKKIEGNSQKALDDTMRSLEEDARSRPSDHKHKFDIII